LAQEDHETASIWAEERDLFVNDDQTLVGIDYFTLIDLIVFARLLVTQGRLDEFNRLMKQLYHSAEAGGRLGRLIEIRILQAYAFQSTGDIDRALKTLKRALALAEPKGFIRIFVDEGPPMARLLYEALNRGIEPEYVQRLLAAFPVTEPEKTFPTKPQVDPSELIEPLSEREIEVLQLLAKGLTNQVIATRLVLSPHTVKTHARNIYSKLAVSNRIQAVDKARTLGILPPD
jgi:LuxR family maltose regulon positive regulatory protein